MMRWGTLFSGVGGVEWGLTAAGHQVAWAVERDAIAAQYHRLNHPNTHLIHADVQDVDVTELENIQALWASPPCQSHSQARRKNLPERDDVWVGRDILRYAAELEPRVVMIENVPGYRKHPVYREIVTGLVDLGYTVEARLLNCADYGIPQTRERLIVQARRDERIAWPQASARRVGWYEAIKDILPVPDKPLAPWQAKRWEAAYNALGPVICDSQFAAARNPGAQHSVFTLRRQDEPVSTITANSNRLEIIYPVLIDGQLGYGNDVQNIIPISQPAPTVIASDHSRMDIGYPAAVPMRARLNARCAARLQTLPDDAVWPETFGKAIRLIGNAVPSRLAQLLAEATEAPVVWNVSLWGRESAA